MRVDCGSCGGSGGGPEHWACGSCRGSGTVAVDPDTHKVCEVCEEVTYEDDLACFEDGSAVICDGCADEHYPKCLSCECHFLKKKAGRFCDEQCLEVWMEDVRYGNKRALRERAFQPKP